jgi:arylsulfatase
MPDKPFFMVFRSRRDARLRTTSPRSGRTGTRVRFDQGWDALREEIVERQKELGVIPPRRS